jgi:hypothetical protein
VDGVEGAAAGSEEDVQGELDEHGLVPWSLAFELAGQEGVSVVGHCEVHGAGASVLQGGVVGQLGLVGAVGVAHGV